MIQYLATGREIHRHRDADARDHCGMRPSFAQVFQRHIATKAESDQHYLLIHSRRMFDHGRQIARIPAVIKPEQAVCLCPASAKIPG